MGRTLDNVPGVYTTILTFFPGLMTPFAMSRVKFRDEAGLAAKKIR